MNISLRTEPKGAWKSMDVEDGSTLEALYLSVSKELPYRVFAAKVNNKMEDLNFVPKSGDKIELLDMRSQSANLVYQHSLCLIYLRAVEKVLGKVGVAIDNSINKGLYTRILKYPNIKQGKIKDIEREMRKLVEADLPFKKSIVSREEGLRLLSSGDMEEKRKLLNSTPHIKEVKFYSLDGHIDFFYGLMVPSTSYIDKFRLVKCGRGIVLQFPHPRDPNKMPSYDNQVKLYRAFSEQYKWDKLLGVRYVSDLNEKIANGEYKDLVQLSEALHEKKIARIADEIKRKKSRIILIAGPSSSGKTTFARRLCVQLRVNGMEPLYMGTDDYFVEREDTPLDRYGEKDYENLNALDIELFNGNMNDLLAGKEVDLPTFDFITGHKVFGKRVTKISDKNILVIEGIHGLNDELTKFIPSSEKFKIYISPLTQLNIDAHNRVPTTDERMLRRMVRDYLFRGKSAKETIASWPKVREGEDVNIFPYCEKADVFFNSYHVYEISLLKKYALPLLEEIDESEEEYAEAVRMLKFLRFFKTMEDEDIVVNNSIMREFIGGSIFVE